MACGCVSPRNPKEKPPHHCGGSMKQRWLSRTREPLLRPGSSLASIRRPSKTVAGVYFFRGGLLSRSPPEGFPGFFDGMPPPLLFEPPERLPPLFLLLLFLDIVLESFVGWPRSSGRRGGLVRCASSRLEKVGRVGLRRQDSSHAVGLRRQNALRRGRGKGSRSVRECCRGRPVVRPPLQAPGRA